MKGFKRNNQLLSLCGLNCGLCPMHIDGSVQDVVVEQEIKVVGLLVVVWNMIISHIVMNVHHILVINT